MKLTEFKAFLEGFEYGFANGAPSAEQWQIIKDKLHQVQAETTTITKRDWDREIIGPGRIDPPIRMYDHSITCAQELVR